MTRSAMAETTQGLWWSEDNQNTTNIKDTMDIQDIGDI